MNNIILIGMAGAGKSTVGVLLAKALGLDFLDTDILIQREEGCSLQTIISERGIKEFLAVEDRVLSSLNVSSAVIATGGSAVYSENGMKNLSRGGKTVFLYVSPEEIVRRVKNISTRGIVMAKGETIGDVYAERLPLYQKYADITVKCGEGTIEETISLIIDNLS